MYSRMEKENDRRIHRRKREKTKDVEWEVLHENKKTIITKRRNATEKDHTIQVENNTRCFIKVSSRVRL